MIRIAREFEADIDAIALAAVLAQPWTTVALSGAVTSAQLASNLTALDVRLTRAQRATLASLAEPPDHYWKQRSQLPWA